MDKKTPLYDTHIKYGGKIVEFGGFLLPVQYGSGVKAEHMAVRTQCGLFDVSHMGEILVQGEKAKDFLNMLLTNDYTDLQPGFARYSPMCNENGGTVDDLIVYMKAENDYFVVVNAANTDKDFAWMCDHKIDGVELTNVSEQYGQVALQGPKAETILRKVVDEKFIPAGYYTCIFDAEFLDFKCMISRTGYTGEDGFEIYMPADKAVDVWEALIAAGKDDGLIPCALGARDTLRMEAAMPLYGLFTGMSSMTRSALEQQVSDSLSRWTSLTSSEKLLSRRTSLSRTEESASKLQAAAFSESILMFTETARS